jgi:hypothetical protein
VSDSDSDDSDADSDDPEPEDKMFAEFTAIKRTKLKYKCEFRNAMLHLRGRDYVIKNISTDIDY